MTASREVMCWCEPGVERYALEKLPIRDLLFDSSGALWTGRGVFVRRAGESEIRSPLAALQTRGA